VLALRRKGLPEHAWQMPQGGIEADETPRQAVLRELQEETGLRASDVDLVTEVPDWLVYELPREFRRPKLGWGQAQKWFLLRARDGARVTPDGREFDAYDWLPPSELLTRVIAFRRPVYEVVLRAVPGATASSASG
jgi:putative (di)nucleoside polyphosphate hydrolase